MPKSLTVSQLLGRGQLTLGNKVTQTLVTFPLGSKDRQAGPKGQGCLEGTLGLSKGDGGEAGEGLCLALGKRPSPVREHGTGAFW